MAELRVRVVTDGTDVRLLPSVSPHVNSQRVLVDERLHGQQQQVYESVM